MSQFGLGQGVAQAANTGGGHYMETASTCTLASMRLVVMCRTFFLPNWSGLESSFEQFDVLPQLRTFLGHKNSHVDMWCLNLYTVL